MVAVGWQVIEIYARRRETRTDLRSAVQSFSAAVFEVRDVAVTFYGLHGNDPLALSLAATIRAKVANLTDQLAIMKSAGLDIDADELLKRFRQGVTGGEFDSYARQPFLSSSPVYVRMSAEAESLSSEVKMAMLKILLKK